MEMPTFSGDEGKDETNLKEWLRMVKNKGFNPFGESLVFWGELLSGGISLIKILDSTPHGESLKNSSQINGSRIKEWRRCVKFKMS
jgi:hypothetical protein